MRDGQACGPQQNIEHSRCPSFSLHARARRLRQILIVIGRENFSDTCVIGAGHFGMTAFGPHRKSREDSATIPFSGVFRN
jgi:hypothetical protein